MLIQSARQGTPTDAIKQVAAAEGVSEETIIKDICAGHVIIPVNKNHAGIKPLGIGKGLSTKINANIGTSKDCTNLDDELKKLEVSI